MAPNAQKNRSAVPEFGGRKFEHMVEKGFAEKETGEVYTRQSL